MINPGLYAKVPYDPYNDFNPVTEIATTPNVLVVHPSVPAKTVRELIDFVRASPGKSSYANPGTGTPSHLSGEMFKLAVKIDMVAVPFQGGGPMIQSVIGNHTPIAFSSMPPAAPQIKEGRLRALAVTSAKRSVAVPEVPTMAEAGVADQEGGTPQGILVPKGAPKEVIDLLHRETVKVIALADVQQKLAAIGFERSAARPRNLPRGSEPKCRNGRRSSATPTSNRNDEQLRSCYPRSEGRSRDGLLNDSDRRSSPAGGRTRRGGFSRNRAACGGRRSARRPMAHRPDARNQRHDRPASKRDALPDAGSRRRPRHHVQSRQPDHQFELRARRA
jgi:hypothetical protein